MRGIPYANDVERRAGYLAADTRYRKQYYRALYPGLRQHIKRSDYVPQIVLAERDHAICAARSITAEVFGDPLPGRSALDKRGMQP